MGNQQPAALDLDLDKLEALARAATPGPWERGDGKMNGASELIVYGEEFAGAAICEMRSNYNHTPIERRIQNLDFIAAANPATVLQLIALVHPPSNTEGLDVRYEFEKWMSDRGEAASYIGDGLYSSGAVTDLAEAFAAGVAIARANLAARAPAADMFAPCTSKSVECKNSQNLNIKAASPADEAKDADEPPSQKHEKLRALADRIDYERLWRRPGLDRLTGKLTDEQCDRLDAGVELRRYADLMAPGRWLVLPPTGCVQFSAGSLDKVYEMAKRDEARRAAMSATQATPKEEG